MSYSLQVSDCQEPSYCIFWYTYLLRSVRSFHSREEKAQDDLLSDFQYLKGTKRTEALLSQETKDNRYMFHWERFNLDIIWEFFTVTTINRGITLSSDVVKSFHHWRFSRQLDRMLNNPSKAGPDDL